MVGSTSGLAELIGANNIRTVRLVRKLESFIASSSTNGGTASRDARPIAAKIIP